MNRDDPLDHAEQTLSSEPVCSTTDTGSSHRTASLPGRVITGFAELAGGTLLDERALAETLGVTKRTVRRMVARYELPPPVAFAGRSMWQVRRVLGWFEARADRLERDAARNARRVREFR